jgi:hypothetical protein
MNILKSVIIACALLFFASASVANDNSSGTGTVVETMDSGGYTYVLLEENNLWVAGPPATVSVGDNVTYANAVNMGQFQSRTLNRTFDNIVFTQSLTVVKPFDAEAHANAAASATMSDQLGIAKSTASAAPEAGEITPAEGGKTIAAIRTEYQQLNGQQVAVRAKVMKVSKNILGKNWITLQDGTGTAPENKLLATSAELAEIGDLVTVKGVVRTDVDLGSGYRYKVVLEEATFSR